MLLTIIKYLVWTAAMLAVALAIVYGFYLILVFMLFESNLVWVAVGAEIFLFWCYWKLCEIAG